MARLVVIYDPERRLILPNAAIGEWPPNLKCASLDVPDDIAQLDLYEQARRLAELLLEQLQ